MRVLIVEDEALISILIENMVRALGHQPVACAYSVSSALALLEETAQLPDAALLDINVAGVPVFPVAEALRARGIPFAFVTGYGALGVPQQFSGATVIQKPFTETDIAFALDALQQELVQVQDSQADGSACARRLSVRALSNRC
jgi:CheY-like chemotaxis protein